MIQDQDVLDIPLAATHTKLDQPGKAERMLMTFFSVGFALLSLYMLEGYSGLLARIGLMPKSLAKIFAAINGEYSIFIVFAVCVVAGLAVAIYREKKKSEPASAWEKFDYWTTTILRYFLAYIFLTYGFAKVFHNQFSTPLSVLDTRLADISGFNLTWRFFGYSYAYTLFVASSQILCSFLFFFRRTTTLAAMILLPIIANIVFMNFAYGIPVKLYSCIYLVMTLFLLSQDARRIKALVWDNRPFGKPTFPILHKSARLAVLKYAVIVIVVAAPVWQMYYSHAAFAKTTTPLAGTWAVQEYKVNGQLLPQSNPLAWKRFYVDSDRLSSVRRGGSRASIFFSSFDSAKQTIALKRGMGTSAKLFLQGTYRLGSDGMLTIDGHDAKGAAIEVTLTRVKNAG